ncbi:MAG: hypothetical protein EAS52_12020 [Parapedobacter sp.]|nr:MAG: hypothetical protein EAS52_12020 [Parapedobacter sp.]
MNMEEDPFRTILSKIYLLYYKSKMHLSEAHLFRTTKDYTQKFQIEIPFKCDLDILDCLVGHRSPVYGSLSRKAWILFVIEISKILSKSDNDAFAIRKFYNSLRNKNIKADVSLDCFKPVLDLIDSDDERTVIGRLRILRHKYYAHEDAKVNRLTDRLFPTYNDVWELMDLLEEFLIAMYSQLDTHIDLEVERHLHMYLREFKRTYQYFKTIEDKTEIYLIQRTFGDEKFNRYMNSME